MSELKHSNESAPAVEAEETDEAFEGFLGALGLLPPEMLSNPDAWLSLSDTDAMHVGVGNLAHVPILTEHWN